MRIRFTQDAQLESEGRNRGPQFQAGDVHDLEADQAQRWIRRGVAEEVGDEPVAVAAEVVEPPPPAPEPPPEPEPQVPPAKRPYTRRS